MDSDGVMRVALCDQSAPARMNAAHIENEAVLIGGSSIIGIDSSVPAEAEEFILGRFPDVPVYLDPIAADLAARSAPFIGKFDTVKANRFETALLSGVEIPPVSGSEAEIGAAKKAVEQAAAVLTGRGLRRVFVSLGKAGSYCGTKAGGFFVPVLGGRPVNTSGGGDAFMAGVVWGSLSGWDDEKTAYFASAMAGLAVASTSTVRPDISVSLAEELVQHG
jgi:pseudouridine kinase